MKNSLHLRAFFVLFCSLLLTSNLAFGLVISEIMYHPVEDNMTPSGNEVFEFIELYNYRAVSEDLSGYAFINGIKYVFPQGTSIGPKSYLVIAKNPSELMTEYDITGVLGPFESGSLNNDGERIELANCNGQIILSVRYNDGMPWPPAADGTGHSLILTSTGKDPEEASSWAASTFIGGSPGKPDLVQAEPQDPETVTLVDIGDPIRYFKGTQEPSPDTGGNPTTDWTAINFNDDPATTDWIDGFNGPGYSSEADELVYIKSVVSDMNGQYVSLYSRTEFTLTQDQIDSFTGLRSETHYDDSYILYLNGTRVSDSGVTETILPYNLPYGPATDPIAKTDDLSAYINLLVPGRNVISIQAHNANLSGSSDCFGAPVLKAVVEEPQTRDSPEAILLINELLTNSEQDPGTDWLEIYNPGPVSVDLSNIYLSDGRFELLQYKLPDGVVLEPGDFYTVNQQAATSPDGFPFGLGFAGETVFLTAGSDDPVPVPVRVLDAVRFGVVEEDVTLGRYPDGSDNFIALSNPTYNAQNARPLIRDIVINEIMYQHASKDKDYEYIELFNKGTETVDLENWKIRDAVKFDFPQGVSISPNSYIVIAEDPNTLAATYSNLVKNVNLFGPWDGDLGDHSETIRLEFPIIQYNPGTQQNESFWVTADEVTYYDGGRWPIWADGQGSSLELIDPRSDNDNPDAWTCSDESSKSAWQQFSYTIQSGDSNYTHDQVTVFDMMLLNRGELLLDDIQLTINGSNRLSNNGFESGETGWRMLGNHVRSNITTADKHSGSRAMHLIATGHGDPGANRLNQTITAVTGGTVTFRGWARWIKGSRYLLMRTTRELSPVQPPRPSYSFELDIPMNLGTPGAQNSGYAANRGPNINKTMHRPVLPAANEPVIVTSQITDNDGISGVYMYYRSEGDASFSQIAMVDDGSGNDMVAGDSIYTATIPGAPAGTMRAFYIIASDGLLVNRFPTLLQPSADVPDRTCLVRIADTPVASEFATYRIWFSNDVRSTFTSRPNLSNELMDCTFVYDDSEVFYNARFRFRGSPFLRSGFGRDPVSRSAFRIDFNPDQKFRDREEINLDNTEGGSRGPLQERASYWFYKKMGLQFSSQEYIRPVINGRSERDYEDVQKIDGDYIDGWFPDDNDGYIHKIDDYFEYSADGTSHSNKDEGLIYDSSHPLIKETYRWGFEKRSNRENDQWQHLLDFAQAMNTPASNPDYETIIESFINPAHFTKVLSLRHAVGDWDSYGYTRGKNNYFYYALPEGKWYLLPWDIDFTLGSGNGATSNLFQINGQFPEVQRLVNYPKYHTMYLQALSELANGPWQTSYGTNNPPTEFDIFLDENADVLVTDGGSDGRRNAIKEFVRDRRNYILTQVPSVKFEITLNQGMDFCSPYPTTRLRGTAPIEVTGIAVNGVVVDASFSETTNAFEIMMPLEIGVNTFNLQGLNNLGNPLNSHTDSITVTRIAPITIESVSPGVVCNTGSNDLTIIGEGFIEGGVGSVSITNPSEELGFDALYVQNAASFDRIEAATLLLDDPSGGIDDELVTYHDYINFWNSGNSHGEFTGNEESFAAPFTDNFALRLTGYIYAPSAGRRYFGVNSDEGFELRIDGQLVGQWATGREPATSNVNGNTSAGTMTFDFPEAGHYYLELDYFDNISGESLEFFQTNSTGGDMKLINLDSELVVYRGSATRIDATDLDIPDDNTMYCKVDTTGAKADFWNIIITPQCGNAGNVQKDNMVKVINEPPTGIDWSVRAEHPDGSIGRTGGPFSTYGLTYVISNEGESTIDCAIAKAAHTDWADMQTTLIRTIEPGKNVTAAVFLNDKAYDLPAGVYSCPLVFSVGCNQAGPSIIEYDAVLTVYKSTDLNLDNNTNIEDLLQLSTNWLESCYEPSWCQGADINKSGTVNIQDLSEISLDWLGQ